MTDSRTPDMGQWPHRVTIVNPDGSVSFFGRARGNADGSVTVEDWGDKGPFESTYPQSQVRSLELSHESSRWLKLYQRVYGRSVLSGDA